MVEELLREVTTDGFPTDYVLARVRGRRAALAADWRATRSRGTPGATSDEAIWEALLQEFAWLRAQMNPNLRHCLGPVFGLFELKTLVLAVRNKASERRAQIERLLADSQLGDSFRRALLDETDVVVAIAAITRTMHATTGEQVSLSRAYAESGLRGFESRLTRTYLEHVVAGRLHAVVREFFECFIDLRNVMTLYKQIRWQLEDAAAFIPGGTVEVPRLARASAGKDAAALDTLVEKIVGRAAPPISIAEGTLESLLLRSLGEKLRRFRSAGEDAGLLLDYIWQVYLDARNRSILLHAEGTDQALLDKELVA